MKLSKQDIERLYAVDLQLGGTIDESPLTRAIITEALEGGGANSIDGTAEAQEVAAALYRLARDIEDLAAAIEDRYAPSEERPQA